MNFFTTNQERRLWLWTLAVLIAIYSTLGPARTLVDALRERNLLRVSFGVLVLVVVVVVAILVWKGLKRRPSWGQIGVGLGVALAYGAAFLRIGNPAERTHLIEYGVVAALMYQALAERNRQGRRTPAPAALSVALTAFLGLVDEVIQFVLPSRVFDWNDVLFNSLAAFMAIVATLALAPVRRPGWRLWFLWLVAGFVGWGVCMDPGWAGEGSPVSFLPFLPPVVLPRYLNVAAGSTIAGVLHWVILRRYVPGAVLWAVVGLGAAGLCGILVMGVGLADRDQGWITGVATYGTLAGMVQWLLLRRQVPRAAWWVLASTVGWLAAIPVGDMVGPPGWAIYSGITGTVLVVLLRQDLARLTRTLPIPTGVEASRGPHPRHPGLGSRTS